MLSTLCPLYPVQSRLPLYAPQSDETTLVDGSPCRSFHGETTADGINRLNYQQSLSSDYHHPGTSPSLLNSPEPVVPQDSTSARSVMTHFATPTSSIGVFRQPIYAPFPRLAFAPNSSVLSRHNYPTILDLDSEYLPERFQTQSSGEVSYNNPTPRSRIQSRIYFDSPTSDPFDVESGGYEFKVD
jgi:hypothetical protein